MNPVSATCLPCEVSKVLNLSEPHFLPRKVEGGDVKQHSIVKRLKRNDLFQVLSPTPDMWEAPGEWSDQSRSAIIIHLVMVTWEEPLRLTIQ